MKIITKLPHWVISNPSPSFYETEGGTVLEQTGIMYKKMQELIENYNNFVDETNKTIDEFVANTLEDQEAFEIKINQIVHDFTSLVDTKLKSQDALIKEAVSYMKANIENTTRELLSEMITENRLTVDLEYNPNTESLDIKGVTVIEGGNN